MIVSHSEVDAHLLCERRHYYAFGERLQKKVQSISLTRGISGHSFMKSFMEIYRATGDFDKAIAGLDAAIATMLTPATPVDEIKLLMDLHQRMVGWLTHFRAQVETWTPVYIEHTFMVSMTHMLSDLTFAFTPDLVIRRNGQLEVVDWKFPYNFYNPISMALLPQLPKYVSALRMSGKVVRKGWYAEIRYRSMKDPSKSQLYKLTAPMLAQPNLQRTWHEYSIAVAEIAKHKASGLVEWEANVKRVGNNLVCNSCSFKELCAAEKGGSDGMAIRRNMYVPSTYGYVEVDE